MDLSLVLACYNEGPLLHESVGEILSVLEATRFSFELIFVDDASSDDTRKRIQEIVQAHEGRVALTTLFHEKNVGRGGSVRDGFGLAQAEVIGFIDVDLEIPAHYILPCLLAIQRGSDVAIGKRIYKFKWKALDRFLISKGYAWLIHRILRLNGLTDTETGYKFFKRERVLPLLKRCRENGWFWDTEIMALCHLAGLSIQEVPCTLFRRFDKISSVKPLRDSVDSFLRLMRFQREINGLRSELKSE